MAEVFWTIDDFPQLAKEETASVDSVEFYGGTQNGVQTRWKLQLCHKDANANISVFLKLTRSNWSAVTAEFIVNLINSSDQVQDVLSCVSKRYDYMNDQSGSGWLQLNLLTTSMKNLRASNFLFGDRLRIHCKVYSIKPVGTSLSINMPTNNCSLSDRFWAMYEQHKETDFTIVVGKKEFPVHKIVLRSHSKVFDAMLDHDDVAETANSRYEIKDFNADTIEKMIKFVYTGECGDLGECSTEVLKCAEKYDIPALKSEAEVALVRKLSATDAPGLLQLADIHGAQLLKSYALDFIRDNLREVMTADYWKMLSRPLVDEVILKLQDAIEKK